MSTLDSPPLEFHFHLYFETEHQSQALELLELVTREEAKGRFVARILRLNPTPVGPHPCPSCEIWVPIEHFMAFYSFLLLCRPPVISVFIHPLTVFEVLDHTERAMILGNQDYKGKLKLEALTEKLPAVPLQYPDLLLGYSSKAL